MPYPELEGPSRRQGGIIVALAILMAVLIGARKIASLVID